MIYRDNSFEERRLPKTTLDRRVAIVRNHIAARCAALQITQDIAAQRCGLTLRQFHRLIHGDHVHGPWLTTCVQVAIGLETTIHRLWTFKTTRPRR